MDLMHNQTFKIIDDELDGIYRVILDEPTFDKTVVAHLDPKPDDDKSKGGRKLADHPEHPRKKSPAPNVGTLIWIDRDFLEDLYKQNKLQLIAIEKENPTNLINSENNTDDDLYEQRKETMEDFLSIDMLRKYITPQHGIAPLVKNAMSKCGRSKANIYKLFSLLCRFGFSEKSLHPDYDKCGAPGVPKPCDPDGRKKAGTKTTKQKIAQQQGIILEPEQPGMSSEWTTLILAADSSIPKPKPKMPDRIVQIHESAFITKYQMDKKGRLNPVDPGLGMYPNSRQIRRVLEREISRIQKLLNKTTNGHYQRSQRGLSDKSWKNIAGPGHLWAIDSTVGDIYLRSSINRAWIIGRPIVYIIVDEWSTGVVGFYVCLRGPSWDMAKHALFCSGTDPALIGSLWGYEPVLSLDPLPTLPADLLCDRGEYLSYGAKQTGMKLLPCESYTPPYRPDLKGLVEVLHRIEKDKQYPWTPGAIDARRKEYDLKQFNPHEAVLTVREYVHYLHSVFTEYNLTAERGYRLDAHMKADGVMPSPAGLWNWGHRVGIGLRRAVSFTDLVTELLPSAPATVTRGGVMLGGKQYESDLINEQQWTTLSRNYGSWKIPANYFHGSVSSIWTPKAGQAGLLQLNISDQSTASPELTWDEILDANEYYKINNAEREHARTINKVAAKKNREELLNTAKQLTQQGIERDTGSQPNILEARELERGIDTPDNLYPEINNTNSTDAQVDEAEAAYHDAMRHLLESNSDGN